MIRVVDGEDHISLASFHFMEDNVASMLHEIDVDFPQEPERLQKILQSVSEESSVVMDEQQLDAVRKAFLKGLVVITGGPGTGKTTTINQMIYFITDALCISLSEFVLDFSFGIWNLRQTVTLDEVFGHLQYTTIEQQCIVRFPQIGFLILYFVFP